MTSVEAFGVEGVGEVGAGDDVAALFVDALAASGRHLHDGDVVVVSSKVVSKAAGLVRQADDREAAVAEQTVRVVAERVTPRGVTRIVEAPSGVVLAAAGVDASNVVRGTVLVLPADPDGEADGLRRRLRALTGLTVGVVVSDTMGRPWRDGQVDLALGAAGLDVADDLRGTADPYGNPLEATVRAVADEVASLADLVKGKVDGVPAAVVRGLAHLVRPDPGPGARALQRTGPGDWFRWGHVEAMHAAIGVQPGAVPPAPVVPQPLAGTVARAVAVATASADLPGAVARVEGDGVHVTGDPVAVGALAQRLLAALRAADLSPRTSLLPDGVLVTPHPPR